MSYLKEFSRNSKAYDKQTSKEVEESTKSYLRGDFEKIEVDFVDGLFEMCKLRELIAKTKAEIISDGMASTYKHKFGTTLFTNNITFRSARIENLVLEKGWNRTNKRKSKDHC